MVKTRMFEKESEIPSSDYIPPARIPKKEAIPAAVLQAWDTLYKSDSKRFKHWKYCGLNACLEIVQNWIENLKK